MTEIKYIFPKQLQSVAALAFIAVHPDCNGTYEEQKTETYAGRTDGGKTDFGQDVYRFYGCLLCGIKYRFL